MQDWWDQTDATPSFMCPSPIGLKVFDVEIALTAQLVDEETDEIVAEDHIVVTPRCPQGDQNAWCAEICAG